MKYTLEICYIVFILIYSYAITHFVPKKLYSFVNIFLALGAILFGVGLGHLDITLLGLNKQYLIHSLLIGVLISIPIILLVYTVALNPKFSKHFYEVPSKNYNRKTFAYELLFRVPFGTAFSEEVIFRSVLLGLLLVNHPNSIAIFVSAILFGLWHIFPTLKNLENNDTLHQKNNPNKQTSNLIATITNVVSTILIGIFFAIVAIETQSFIATWVIHTTINGISIFCGYFLVWKGKR